MDRQQGVEIDKHTYRVDVGGATVLYNSSNKEFNLNTRNRCSIEDLYDLNDALDILLKYLNNGERKVN